MILPITVKAPGKLILSGEHAVVYGSPALATAVNCYTTVHLVPEPGEIGFFDFPDLGFKASFGAPALALLLQKLNSRLAAFTAQKISVKALLDHPAELLLYAAGLILEQAGFPPVGFKCTLSSTIPMSAGMGSSGSSIVAIQYAFKKSLGCEINTDDFLALALKAEQLQHGRSSGLDLKLAYHGGIQFSDQGVLHPRSYSLPDLAIVNTGKPKSSTGECVMQAQPFFKNQPELLSAFADTTRNIDRALTQNNFSLLKQYVAKNHRLLCQIGVVPKQVQTCVSEIENLGGAAKVCGAGSIRGNAGGCLWVFGIDPSKVEALKKHPQYVLTPALKGVHVCG